jgi:urease accessory protein
MVAVGLWGAFLGAPAIWILPVVFPLVMALGGALGVAGVPIPMIETGIALSGVVLGLLIAFAVKAPIWVAAVIVGVFAIFHGHAHGTELPEAFSPYGYAVGFVIGTGLLHLVGIGLGVLTRSEMGRYAVRGAGGVIALGGRGIPVRPRLTLRRSLADTCPRRPRRAGPTPMPSTRAPIPMASSSRARRSS